VTLGGFHPGIQGDDQRLFGGIRARSPGAAISVTTKSGTNQFRGVVYEFLRNRKFDANNWVLNRSGQPKPQHIQNRFGANLGGPIVGDRAFFFFDYEGTRIRKGTTRLGSVPLANERRGDFSPAAAAANRTSYAPLVDRVGDCMGRGMPFPGNQIPATCFDPVAKRILDMLPEPNLVPAAGPLNTFNFVRSPSIVDDTDDITTRLWMMSYFYQHDWKLNPRLTLNFGLRYDFATWPYEGGNRMTNVDPATGTGSRRPIHPLAAAWCVPTRTTLRREWGWPGRSGRAPCCGRVTGAFTCCSSARAAKIRWG